MTLQAADGQRKARVTLVVLASATILAVALVGVLVYVLLRAPAETTEASPQAPSARPTPATDGSWESVAGVELPFSATHGPRVTADGRAAGFTDSELGAALAAVHILVRTGANVGPDVYEPTITQQVAGANAAAMKVQTDQQYEQLRAAAGVEDGEPVPGGNAEVLGYRLSAFDETTATVEVVMTAPDLAGQVLVFDVELQRANDDWQVIAPPRGDWGVVTATMSTTPEGMQQYGENG